MEFTAKVLSRDRITLPKEVRTLLNLKTGDKVIFEIEDGVITLHSEQDEENPFAEYAGAFPTFGSVEEINAWIAEMRDED